MKEKNGDKIQKTKPEHISYQPPDIQTRAKNAEADGDWKAAAHFYAQGYEQRAVELALINSVQEGLSSQSEMQAIYDLVGDKLRDTFDSQVVMISQYDPETERIFHHYAIERGVHLQIPGWHPIDSSRSKVIKTKKPFIIYGSEIMALLEAAKMEVVPGTEIPKTWLGVPMIVSNEAIGIVSLQNLDKEYAFTKSEINLLTTLTNSLSQSLENARLFNETQRLLNLMEEEMGFARQAQQSILPMDFPRHSGYDFGSLIKPALAVGGDFYDFLQLDKDRLGIVIGDVSDKGLQAALFMAVTLSLVRAETKRTTNQSQILQNVNNFLLNMNAKMFVTLLFCTLDLKSGNMEFSRAGHLPPMMVDSQGKVTEVKIEKGLPLGVFENVRIDHQKVAIPEGGLTLLYSDGIHEATNSDGKVFGYQGVKKELLTSHQKNAQTICESLWHAVQKHSGDIPHQDDFTAVIVKRI